MENPTGAGSVSKHPHANKGESQKEVSPTRPPLPVSSWAPVGGGEMMRPFFSVEEDMLKDANWATDSSRMPISPSDDNDLTSFGREKKEGAGEVVMVLGRRRGSFSSTLQSPVRWVPQQFRHVAAIHSRPTWLCLHPSPGLLGPPRFSNPSSPQELKGTGTWPLAYCFRL